MACQCHGCHDGCYSATQGCSSCATGCSQNCGDCGSSCGFGCKNGCEGCDNTCDYTCTGSCKGTAKCTTCQGACTGTAQCSTCRDTCDGCDGSCSGSCSGDCDGSCSGGCSSCSGRCSGCSNACSDASKRDAIENLGKNILRGEYIKEEDFLEIKKHISEEFRRRGVKHHDENFDNPVPTHGGFVLAEHAKKCFQAIANYNPKMNYVDTAKPGALVTANNLDDIIEYLKSLMKERV